MNLGISNAQVSAWKRIKSQHVILAAGIALAVSVVIATPSLRGGSSKPATQTTPPVAAARIGQTEQTFIYIVGSQAEGAALQQAFGEADAFDGGRTVRQVLVVDSAVSQGALQTLEGELLSASMTTAGLIIVDLRAVAAPVARPASSELTPGAYPLVQEMSHPQIDAVASSATEDLSPGAYPLVQEMSHPR